MKGCDCIKKYIKGLTLTVCALLLSLSVYGSYTVPVKAASIDPPFTQVLDIALSKVGISANLTTLSELENMYLAGLNEIYAQYKVYLQTNNRADTEENFIEFCQINSELDVLQMLDFLTYKELYHPEFLPALGGSAFSTLVIQMLKNYFCVSDGNDYVVPDSVVDGNKKMFDEMIDEYTGYYYIKTLTTDELLASYFPTISEFNNFVSYINSSDKPTIVLVGTAGSVNTGAFDCNIAFKWVFDNSVDVHIVRDVPLNGLQNLYFCDNDANYYPYKHYRINYGKWNIPFYDEDSFKSQNLSQFSNPHNNSAFYGYYDHGGNNASWSNVFVFTKDGRKLKVYKSKQDLMNAMAGTDPYHYYINSTYDYSTSTDNSVTVGRDYFMNNNGTYSYDTITEYVQDNSDNSYTAIDNSMNQIINNYYGSGSSGGSDDGSDEGSGSGSDDDEGGFWDAMTKIVDGIGDFFNFLLTLIGELITLFTAFLNQIMDLVGSFAGVGGDFVLFMSEFFVFVPQQIWDVITLGVTASVAIAIYKFFVK